MHNGFISSIEEGMGLKLTIRHQNISSHNYH